MYVRSLFEKILDRNTKVISKDFKFINFRLTLTFFPIRKYCWGYPGILSYTIRCLVTFL